jgi:hypothetical protein
MFLYWVASSYTAKNPEGFRIVEAFYLLGFLTGLVVACSFWMILIFIATSIGY